MAFGFFSSGITVIIEAALQKHYLGTTDHPGLIACAAMLFLNVTCFGLFVEGVGFCYIAEIWPNHTRGEGYALGMFSLCVSSIIWLQSAPTAFDSIGWKFYIIFIVFDALAAAAVLFYPNTLGKPLEEVAALFGDDDMVAVFQADLDSGVLMGENKSAEAIQKAEAGQIDEVETANA